jgi:hypothetical protein
MLIAMIFAALLVAMPALAAGKLYYGSRIGMEVDVIGVSGIGTSHAVIRTRHTRENARAFCKQYANDLSERCIEQQLRDTHLNDQIEGNCETGWFTTLYGEQLHFIGENKRRRETDPRYIIMNGREPLDGSSASGYPYNLEQFKALCPARVPVDDE